MALTPGTRLGVYDVTARIGEGGMGQVYRATDTTLGRQVAIKILPDAFASDPERLARSLSAPKKLFDLDKTALQAAPLSGRSLFGVSPDGQRFLMVQRVGKHDTSRALVVVQDWLAEFANRIRH